MQNLTKATLLALMMAATPLWAQESATDDATTEEPAAEAADAEAPADGAAAEETPAQTTNPDEGLSMGTPEGEQPANGEPAFETEVFGDWELRCLPATEEQPEQCQLYQLLRDQNGNDVAEFNLFALPAGGQAQAGANIVTPLETLLTEQLTLAVDGAQGKRYPYTFCTRVGCVARIGFTAADVNAFKAGQAARLTLVPAGAPDQRVQLTVSLSGFTAGFTELQARSNTGN